MIGTLLQNRYELLEKIGEGGMGIVYKAKCHLLNRFVAVKILKTELSNDEEFLARFKREGTSSASLSHPNIVNVHDVGAQGQINFIVMEYIVGKTLKQLIKEKVRLTPQMALDISLQIAKALECAHKNNIIHRDIKPDNIMITEDNIVKVTDFGIAKVLGSRTMTNSNKIMGTAHYFSPEQAKGIFVDTRTDIYSLGVVMYEMVTGRVPYNAESSISIAMMHIQKPVTPPKEIITDLPENVNLVILKAMEKEPVKRFQTANEMGKILESIKENPNFIVNLNNIENNATKIMGAPISTDDENDLTEVMSKYSAPENPTVKKDEKILFANNKPSYNKNIIIIITSIILVIIIGVFGKSLLNRLSNNSSTPIVETTNPKTTGDLSSNDTQPTDVKQQSQAEVPAVQKKFVPSLIGNTKDIAKQNVINNEFSIGNISNNYSDTVAKGLVISQSPDVNTSYEKGGKVDLVISNGKKIEQVIVPQLNGKTLDDAENILDELKLELGEETEVKRNNKSSKSNRLKDDVKTILSQSVPAGTSVDIKTKIDVSYYENKKN